MVDDHNAAPGRQRRYKAAAVKSIQTNKQTNNKKQTIKNKQRNNDG